MFRQILSIIWNNAFLVHKSVLGKNALNHKKFTLEMVDWFMNEAAFASSNRKMDSDTETDKECQSEDAWTPLKHLHFSKSKIQKVN